MLVASARMEAAPTDLPTAKLIGPVPIPSVHAALRLSRAEARLLDELDDDGIRLAGEPTHVEHVVQELDHVRRPPLHEGRSTVYGAFVMPAGRELIESGDLVELIDVQLPLDQARRFADGRSTFLVRRFDADPQLACFRRSIQYEADLVDVQAATGASIVQRTVLGVARLFTDAGVVEWNGRGWVERPTAQTMLATIGPVVDGASPRVLEGILDLCVHWLSPARIGTTVLYDFDPRHDDAPSLDLDAAIATPALSVVVRHHYPALFASLSQTDLAMVVYPDGGVRNLGVGLRSSPESELAVAQDRGMRHRSAARYTWDHRHTIAFVVSEDGPVTVFRRGTPIGVCTGASASDPRCE